MNKKEFLSLSKEDLSKGLACLNESAAKHLEAAQLLAAKNIFGIANSHLILAGEEAIKAAFIHMRLITFDKKPEFEKAIDGNVIEGIFSKHKAKHAFAKGTHKIFVAMLKITIEKTYAYLQKSASLNKEKDIETINTISTFVSKESSPEWWNHADNMKNRGFYVDYHKSKWLLPSHIQKEEYLKSYPIVGQLLAFTQLAEKFTH